MTAYLVRNPPRRRQFKERGTVPSGVCVVHTAESMPDRVVPDSGAEAVAEFIQNRPDPGSYHDIADSDSILPLVPYTHQAYGDGTGSNPHAYHVSAATQAAKWNQVPAQWREDTIRNMAKASARYARWLKAETGITIPARRITRAQSEALMPGFISHGERDPGRRSDPGADFDWNLFLAAFAEEMGTVDRPEIPTTLDLIRALDTLRDHASVPWMRGRLWLARATIRPLYQGTGQQAQVSALPDDPTVLEVIRGIDKLRDASSVPWMRGRLWLARWLIRPLYSK